MCAGLSVHQPTLDEICVYGEREYFSAVRTLCSTPADCKVDIWDALHIYWDSMDEFTLFISLLNKLKETDVSILFGDLDLGSFNVSFGSDISDPVIRNADGVVIDRAVYKVLTDSLRRIHGLKKNTEVGYNDDTRDFMIELARDDASLSNSKPDDSILQPLISAMTNCTEFKYRFDDVWTMPIGAFLDAVKRVQKNKNYDFLMCGVYSGSVDIKKVNKNDFDWTGEL